MVKTYIDRIMKNDQTFNKTQRRILKERLEMYKKEYEKTYARVADAYKQFPDRYTSRSLNALLSKHAKRIKCAEFLLSDL